MKKFFEEFKKFAFKGNVMDLAVAVVIGAAFGAIVTSLVKDIFMPVIGLITGGMNVSGMFVLLGKGTYSTFAEARAAVTTLDLAASQGIATLNYGNFIQQIINFILIAFCIFLVVKLFSKMQKEKPAAPAPKVRKCPFCLQAIEEKATRCPHCTSDLK